MKINKHYLNRYIKFISFAKQQCNRELTYSEMHHIIPRCIGGNDLLENLVKLTAREHFLAHWLLWKAYPNNIKLAFAFWAMCCQPSYGRDYFEKISNYFKNSKIYERLKLEIAVRSSKFHKNKVYVYDPTIDKTICLTKAQYRQSQLKFHTTGMVNVYDKLTGESVWISSSDYRSNKHQFYTNLTYAKFKYVDSTGNEYLLTKQDALALKKSGKELKQIIKSKVKIVDPNGKEKIISIKKYDKDKHTHVLKNKFTVFDSVQCKTITVSKDEYLSNPTRYITSTKGKVLAYNLAEKIYELVDQKLFDNNSNFVGQTKGLTTVYNKKTKSYEQIKTTEYNKSIHSGPCTGKKNIINTKTGIRSQIKSTEFNPEIHLVLGDTRQYFKCRHMLTNKEKNISIFEWNLLKTEYQIIDINQFKKAEKFKKDLEWNQK